MSKLRSGRAARQAAVDEVARDGGSVRPAAHLDIADPSPLADEEVLHGELRAALSKALRELPVLYRTPIILRDIAGLSPRKPAPC
jgi:DNA-directed RNA polymerase specialized sigma24 family protein